jgi:hypothetical protein
MLSDPQQVWDQNLRLNADDAIQTVVVPGVVDVMAQTPEHLNVPADTCVGSACNESKTPHGGGAVLKSVKNRSLT